MKVVCGTDDYTQCTSRAWYYDSFQCRTRARAITTNGKRNVSVTVSPYQAMKDDEASTGGEWGTMEPRTQGQRIRWVRMQLGPLVGKPYGEPMEQAVFAEWIARHSGEEPRAASTISRWEVDEGRGPTIKEGVAMARLVHRTAEWLSALDVIEQAKQARRVTVRDAKPESREVQRPAPVKKQGHGRGRKRA